MAKPKGSSRSWRDRQERDPYVRQARQEGWRSRAVYKLLQIDRKERLLKKGMTVVDLGAAPGGWSQLITQTLDGDVRIIALDLLPMDSLPSVELIQGDFTDDDVLRSLQERLVDGAADLVISDMAPNITGQRAVDQPRSMYLAELALDFCKQVLAPGGNFVCKLFQGEGTDAFIVDVRQVFERVKVMKPDASRGASREVYLVARNYRL
jgi:23S rRNA (uridine2552-2'-O)-methyltransferase